MNAAMHAPAQESSAHAGPVRVPVPASGDVGVSGAALPLSRKRRRTPTLVASLVIIALAGSGGWYLLTRGTESTDDAQVEGRITNIAARVSGQVRQVLVRDNQLVSAGDVLVELDPSDYTARVESARADLSAARANADAARAALALTEKTAPAALQQANGGLAAAASSVDAAVATLELSRANVTAAQSRQTLAEVNLGRARTLFAERAVSQAELDARAADDAIARAELQQAQARLAAAQAATAGSSGGLAAARGRMSAAATADEQLAAARAAVAVADAHVKQAEATLKLAELNLSYTTVRSPRRGVVSRRTVEEGQLVSPERPLLALVPVDGLWVVANFKEDQLSALHSDQPATVRFDTYGGREFRGHVDSISRGTGARFALLPPDNATGNFVKVVQRVPVLIRLDDVPGIELRPGMSADVTVRTDGR